MMSPGPPPRQLRRRFGEAGVRHHKQSVCLAVATAMALAAAACSSIDARTNSFATLAEARDAGAIAQGWLPDGLPAGTHDLRVAWVPDGPERWAIVNFPPAEGETLKALLDGELPLKGIHCDVPTRFEWWPIVLRGTLDEERVRATGLRAYRMRQGGIVAVNWLQGRAYYWAVSQ